MQFQAISVYLLLGLLELICAQNIRNVGPHCRVVPSPGRCPQSEKRSLWSYSTKIRACTQLYGCYGIRDRNVFQTRASCERSCFSSGSDSTSNSYLDCEVNPSPGLCQDSEKRTYFTYTNKINACVQINGCYTIRDKNIFLTRDGCRRICIINRPDNIQISPLFPGLTSNNTATVLPAEVGYRLSVECTVNPSAGACLPSDRRTFYTYSSKSGSCVQIYGCYSVRDRNVFLSRDSCRGNCMLKDTTDSPIWSKNPQCYINPSPGRCLPEDRQSMWTYSSKTNNCQHLYGCYSVRDRNVFRTLSDCKDTCVGPDNTATVTGPTTDLNIKIALECRINPSAGICLDREKRTFYSYSSKTGDCGEIFGCYSVRDRNVYVTKAGCRRSCFLSDDSTSSVVMESQCYVSPSPGRCLEDEKRTYFTYSTKINSCVRIYGCYGIRDRNVFLTRPGCEQACSGDIPVRPVTPAANFNSVDIVPLPSGPNYSIAPECRINPSPGICNDNQKRNYFTFSSKSSSCVQIYGCYNIRDRNVFTRREGCRRNCFISGSATPSGVMDTQCYINPAPGRCPDREKSNYWSYSSKTMTCTRIYGCYSIRDRNVFLRRDACDRSCTPNVAPGVSTTPIVPIRQVNSGCRINPSPGRCAERDRRTYFSYSSKTHRCTEIYGCYTIRDRNVFLTKDSCEKRCFDQGTSGSEPQCSMNPSPGNCAENQRRAYFSYSSKTSTCLEIYGCYSIRDRNVFITREGCRRRCEAPDVMPPIDTSANTQKNFVDVRGTGSQMVDVRNAGNGATNMVDMRNARRDNMIDIRNSESSSGGGLTMTDIRNGKTPNMVDIRRDRVNMVDIRRSGNAVNMADIRRSGNENGDNMVDIRNGQSNQAGGSFVDIRGAGTNANNMVDIRDTASTTNMVDVRRSGSPNMVDIRNGRSNMVDIRSSQTNEGNMVDIRSNSNRNFVDVRNNVDITNMVDVRQGPNGQRNLVDIRSQTGGPNMVDIRSGRTRNDMVDIRSNRMVDVRGNNMVDIRNGQSGNNMVDIRNGQSGNNMVDIRNGQSGNNMVDIRSGQSGNNMVDIRSRQTDPNMVDIRSGQSGNNMVDIRNGQSGNNMVDIRGNKMVDIRSRQTDPSMVDIRSGQPGNNMVDIRNGQSGNNMVDIRNGQSGNNMVDIRNGQSGNSMVDIRNRQSGNKMVDIRIRQPGNNMVDIRNGQSGNNMVDIRNGQSGNNMVDIRNGQSGNNMVDIRNGQSGNNMVDIRNGQSGNNMVDIRNGQSGNNMVDIRRNRMVDIRSRQTQPNMVDIRSGNSGNNMVDIRQSTTSNNNQNMVDIRGSSGTNFVDVRDMNSLVDIRRTNTSNNMVDIRQNTNGNFVDIRNGATSPNMEDIRQRSGVNFVDVRNSNTGNNMIDIRGTSSSGADSNFVDVRNGRGSAGSSNFVDIRGESSGNNMVDIRVNNGATTNFIDVRNSNQEATSMADIRTGGGSQSTSSNTNFVDVRGGQNGANMVDIRSRSGTSQNNGNFVDSRGGNTDSNMVDIRRGSSSAQGNVVDIRNGQSGSNMVDVRQTNGNFVDIRGGQAGSGMVDIRGNTADNFVDIRNGRVDGNMVDIRSKSSTGTNFVDVRSGKADPTMVDIRTNSRSQTGSNFVDIRNGRGGANMVDIRGQSSAGTNFVDVRNGMTDPNMVDIRSNSESPTGSSFVDIRKRKTDQNMVDIRSRINSVQPNSNFVDIRGGMADQNMVDIRSTNGNQGGTNFVDVRGNNANQNMVDIRGNSGSRFVDIRESATGAKMVDIRGNQVLPTDANFVDKRGGGATKMVDIRGGSGSHMNASFIDIRDGTSGMISDIIPVDPQSLTDLPIINISPGIRIARECLINPTPGICLENQQKSFWTFSTKSNSCTRIMGCFDIHDRNTWLSLDGCRNNCLKNDSEVDTSGVLPLECQLNPTPGRCLPSEERRVWIYNTKLGACTQLEGCYDYHDRNVWSSRARCRIKCRVTSAILAPLIPYNVEGIRIHPECHINPSPGVCTENQMKTFWTFSSKVSACTRVTGCYNIRDRNTWRSREECKTSCLVNSTDVSDAKPLECKLVPSPGRCLDSQKKSVYTYSDKLGICVEITGCYDFHDRNVWRTLQACNDRCHVNSSMIPDLSRYDIALECQLNPISGRCQESQKRAFYSFSSKAKGCVEIYGCYTINDRNVWYTKDGCQESCLLPKPGTGSVTEVAKTCLRDPVPGECLPNQRQMWYTYSRTTLQCERLEGCYRLGDENVFISKRRCDIGCFNKPPEYTVNGVSRECRLNPTPGVCREDERRRYWSYSQKTGSCLELTGCYTIRDRNIWLTREMCRNNCIKRDIEPRSEVLPNFLSGSNGPDTNTNGIRRGRRGRLITRNTNRNSANDRVVRDMLVTRIDTFDVSMNPSVQSSGAMQTATIPPPPLLETRDMGVSNVASSRVLENLFLLEAAN